MSRSFTRLWTHATFSTKYRAPLILPKHEEAIHLFMKFQLKKLGCIPIAVNGMHEHVHLLFAMNYQVSVMDVIKQVKGSTSHMINQKKLCQGKFGWQDGFAAFSVSQSKVRDVLTYIERQKEHHAKKTFVQEWEAFEQAHAYMWEDKPLSDHDDHVIEPGGNSLSGRD